jgi:uncharacterized membrane protein YfcA
LLRTPSRVFAALVPYLVLAATLLMALQRPLRRLARTPEGDSNEIARAPLAAAALFTGQLAVSIYGGYFGAGMGILMLAALGLYGVADIHQRNGLKNVLGAVTNGAAGIYFALSGAVAWRDAAILAAGAVLGGYGSAAISRKLDRATAELVVVGIGVAMTVALFLHR